MVRRPRLRQPSHAVIAVDRLQAAAPFVPALMRAALQLRATRPRSGPDPETIATPFAVSLQRSGVPKLPWLLQQQLRHEDRLVATSTPLVSTGQIRVFLATLDVICCGAGLGSVSDRRSSEGCDLRERKDQSRCGVSPFDRDVRACRGGSDRALARRP